MKNGNGLNSEFSPELFESETARALALLSRWPGVKRIWSYGSPAKSGLFDLDLAVEGLSSVDYGQAWAELEESLAVPVNLARWETASPPLREDILRTGCLLFEE